MKIERDGKGYELKDWTPGCYGLKYPATVVTADAVVYRYDDNGDVEILVGVRGSGRWQEGMPMIIFGGFIEPNDLSVEASVLRELIEEVGLDVELERRPFCVTGPLKLNCIWDPTEYKARPLERLAQDIPVVTVIYLALWRGGDVVVSDEVPELGWKKLKDLVKIEQTYAFDMTLVLEDLCLHFL